MSADHTEILNRIATYLHRIDAALQTMVRAQAENETNLRQIMGVVMGRLGAIDDKAAQCAEAHNDLQLRAMKRDDGSEI
jgi:hypothetical protein